MIRFQQAASLQEYALPEDGRDKIVLCYNFCNQHEISYVTYRDAVTTDSVDGFLPVEMTVMRDGEVLLQFMDGNSQTFGLVKGN